MMVTNRCGPELGPEHGDFQEDFYHTINQDLENEQLKPHECPTKVQHVLEIDTDLKAIQHPRDLSHESRSPSERHSGTSTSHSHATNNNHVHPSSNSGPNRTLHEKLSSPDRRKRSPSETKRRQDHRFVIAGMNRLKIDSARQTRLRLAAEKVKHVNARKANKLAHQETLMWSRLTKADAQHEAHLRWIMRKAESENTKVDEVSFIQTLTAEHRKATLAQRLENVAVRRERYLHDIRTRASDQVRISEYLNMSI